MHHHLHPVLAQLRSAEMGRTADIARRRRRPPTAPHRTPRVAEIPSNLTPVERDPFLDGLDGAGPA